MRGQTEAQTGHSRVVRDSMDDLERGAGEAKAAGSRIASDLQALANQAQGLRELAARSSLVASELESTVAGRRDTADR